MSAGETATCGHWNALASFTLWVLVSSFTSECQRHTVPGLPSDTRLDFEGQKLSQICSQHVTSYSMFEDVSKTAFKRDSSPKNEYVEVVLLWNIEDILNNVGNQTFAGPH